MKLIYYPNSFLEKTVADVNIENPGFDPVEVQKEMSEIMQKNKGIGLSANQVGLDAQLFLLGNRNQESYLCINPKITQVVEETSLDYEGCLSFPNIFLKVNRPNRILVEYYDVNLERRIAELEDYTARVFLHEWDHLQGVTFKDRVSKLKWNMAIKKASKLEKING